MSATEPYKRDEEAARDARVAWENRPAADRVTVAPDRDALIEWARDWHAPDGMVDSLLSSGVFGVPADQRTADRETIRKVLREHKVFRYQSRRHLPGAFSFDEDAENALLDAVLAVLVPADQVRAETLEAAAEDVELPLPWDIHGNTGPDSIQRNGEAVASTWLRARAAEYRKAACA